MNLIQRFVRWRLTQAVERTETANSAISASSPSDAFGDKAAFG